MASSECDASKAQRDNSAVGDTTIAVIIPALDQAHALIDAITSVSVQTRPAGEVIGAEMIG